MQNENVIRHISESFNEPAFVQKMRIEAWKESLHLPRHELQYGLGIFDSVAENVQSAVFGSDAVAYDFLEIDGVAVLAWAEAMKQSSVVSLLETYFIPENFPVLKNYYFARSLAEFSSGLVIFVDEGVKANLSIESVVIKNSADFIFIMAKRRSSLRVLDTLSGGSVFFGRTVFVVAEEDASVEILSSQNLSRESSFFANKFSSIGRGGKVSWLDTHFGCSFAKSDIEDFLSGERALSRIRNFTLAGNQDFDFYNASHHKAPHTFSHISARGIAGGGGKIIYRGLIDIDKNCPGSRGDQIGRFLLASSGAEIDAIPSLDIRSSEVVSSHALSISRMKEIDFFYPALRGIEPYRAQAMLFEGFLSHEIDNENILSLIRKKLSSHIYEISN